MIDIDKTRQFKAILVKVHQLYPQQSLENGGYKIAILRPFANLHIMTSSMTSSIFFHRKISQHKYLSNEPSLRSIP